MELKNLASKVARDIFYVSFFSFLGFFILENFKAGFVTNYINVNIVLTICLLAGIAVLFQKEAGSERAEKAWKNYLLMLFVSLLAMVLVWQVISASGIINFSLIILAGIIVFLAQLSIKSKQYD